MHNDMAQTWQELRRTQPLLGVLLGGLDEEALALLTSLTTMEHFDAGACVFNEGASGDCMYVCVSGQFRVSKLDALGSEIELRIIGGGEVFGEIALLEQVRRTATVTALSPATAFRLERADLERHTHLTNRIYGNLARILAKRLRQTTDEILLLETWLRLAENEANG